MDKLLIKICKKHIKWVNFAKKYGGGMYAEDIVQDAYLKINKYANFDNLRHQHENKVDSYVCRVIITVAANYHHRNVQELNKVQDFYSIEVSPEQYAYNEIENKINEVLDKMHWYDRMLFNIYRYQKISIRALAKKTGISTTSIFLTLKKVKAKIREELKEDWQDYLNKDYELL